MALPPDKIRAYRPLLDVLVGELLREFDQELQQLDEAGGGSKQRAGELDDELPPAA